MYIFQHTLPHCSGYNPETKGIEYLRKCKGIQEFKDWVELVHEFDFWTQKDGTIHDSQGREIYDPELPKTFSFGDFDYFLVSKGDLCPIQQSLINQTTSKMIDFNWGVIPTLTIKTFARLAYGDEKQGRERIYNMRRPKRSVIPSQDDIDAFIKGYEAVIRECEAEIEKLKKLKAD